VGTLIVSAGGRANSIAMGVGFMSNSFGTVTVTGAGSRLVDAFNSIYIGYDGAGTLNIADGGIVTVNSGFGTVVVGGTANGGASTLRIGQGAAPGTLQAGGVSLFRANSQLELNHTGIIAFTPVISGPGSVIQVANGTTTLTANNTFTGPVTVRAGLLELSGGGRINNATDSNVADGAGQVASVRINGASSKWINTASTFIGAHGTGSVTVQAGGELRSDVQLLVNRFADGNGTLTVTGAGSKATTNGLLRVADEGVGLLDIENGGVVMSGESYLATNSAAANGTAIVNGAGSLWSIAGHLTVGYTGIGTLRIENAGAVSSGFGEIGYLASSNSSATVTGTNSLWTIASTLTVGDRGRAHCRSRAAAKSSHLQRRLRRHVCRRDGDSERRRRGFGVGADVSRRRRFRDGNAECDQRRQDFDGRHLSRFGCGWQRTALLTGTGSTWTSTSPIELAPSELGISRSPMARCSRLGAGPAR
jgi:T5SS/PEP-CTERM-associated repeat protein/autotransporter-associated beta strand protein